MNYFGVIRKMKSLLQSPVQYFLSLDGQEIHLNNHLGSKISLQFLGHIQCIQCGRLTKKSFQQGFCFFCMQRINECGNCSIFPERCEVEKKTCPQNDWAHVQCDAIHVIYLANTSSIKIGITRHSNVPTRWIDQGAVQALPILVAANRYQSGLVELAMKAFVSDKTQWRAMLRNEVNFIDLFVERDRLLQKANPALTQFFEKPRNKLKLIERMDMINIEYPVLEYPKKVLNLSLDKMKIIQGVLMGIKGQYLILDTGVLNVRKFGGYKIEFSLP